MATKEYYRQWHQDNKERRKAINKRRRAKVRAWFDSYKDEVECRLCGEQENICLEFHHINPEDKLLEVSTMVGDCYAKEKILEEISKCVVLCANCHRKVHAGLVTI